ncbi:beta-ketoacyl synthase N-terminal-like domain-containing protein [Streptacidiphilus neutrinimicus]|uniref:beta-ketoacyl synthase N-terminal-like domain-containing protein n=1 Tax=Streptacidiphilus neutrinimicus TaxID=105420 RepID=UPI0005A88BFC|nr:beta-ketoacyl synthase N-terminal-like domain-containing protein [Streptacidiphilus neutrinimicus]
MTTEPSSTSFPPPEPLYITGWGVLSPLGDGADEFSDAVVEGRTALTDVSSMFEEELPGDQAYALAEFRVRDYLGRKGTSFFDRSTALALVASDRALKDTELVVTDDNRDQVGLVLGTTTGSIKSTSDYSRETLTQRRPYLVNPVLFPNTVMNCAAGQAAIWHKLKGVNATIAGGQLAGLSALRYACRTLRWEDAEALLVGAVEEFSPHTAWATHLATSPVPAGEGAAVFVLETAAAVADSGRRADAEVLAVELATADPERGTEAAAEVFAQCIRRALRVAGVSADELWAVAPGSTAAGRIETAALAAVLGPAEPVRLNVAELVGECHAASGALQIAAVLAHHRSNPTLDGCPALVTSATREGTVGAAVIRGWHRDRGDHGQ